MKYVVEIRRMSWDDQFHMEMASGKEAFIITEPATVSLDGETKNSLFGSNSPLYGSTYGDDNEFAERYSCECKHMNGRQFDNCICPRCGTRVQPRATNLKMTGWMTLGNNKVIAPYYYLFLTKILGKNDLPEIVRSQHEVDTNGNMHRFNPKIYENKSNSPFVGIGPQEFYDRFDEIMDYYKKKKPNKSQSIDILKKEKYKVFTSHIPIYSTKLRPTSTSSDTLYYTNIEKEINSLYPLTVSVKDCRPIDRDYILQRIQKKINNMYTINFGAIDGKGGHIRSEIIGGAYNYTARNVIIPDPLLRVNEVIMAYPTFRILYKTKIISYLMRIYKYDLSQANIKWVQSVKFDKAVYEIMLMIIKIEKPRLLLNRNPTLNFYSMLRMDIKTVNPDPTEYTLAVNIAILPGLNADFDGDILNMIALIDPAFDEMFRKFDPKARMMLDRSTGEMNPLYAISKDLLINLYDFCTIRGSECDTPQQSTCQQFLNYCKKHNIEYSGVEI